MEKLIEAFVKVKRTSFPNKTKYIEKDLNKLFSIKSLADILLSVDFDIAHKRVKIVRNNLNIPIAKVKGKEGHLDINKIFTLFENGYSLVLKNLEKYWTPISEFTQVLEHILHKEFNMLIKDSIRVNGYFSPPKSKGFRLHFDAEDIFILQLEGKKYWNIYTPKEVNPIKSKGGIQEKDIGLNLGEIMIDTGDVFYLPRGYPHEAYTKESHSLHLTISFSTVTWLDILIKTAETVPDFRKDLQINFNSLTDKIALFSQEDIFLRMLENLKKQKKLLDIILETAGEVKVKSKPDTNIAFSKYAVNFKNKLLRKVYSRNDCVIQKNQVLRLYFPGNFMTFKLEIEPLLNFVFSTKDFRIVDLPSSISIKEKEDLLREMITKGFISYVK